MIGLRAKKKIETEDKIKKAAKEIFFSKGYAKTTMEEIAAKAEIGVGTLYNYFKSKDEIYIANMSEELNFDQEDSIQLENDMDKNVAKSVTAFTLKTLKGLKLMDKRIWKELMSVVFGNSKSNNFMFKGMIRFDYKFIDKLKVLLENNKNRGYLLPNFNTDEAAYAIYSVVLAQVILYIYSEDITFNALTGNIENQIRFIFEGKCTLLNK
ncbi:MAG: TetR/AcrR family transcriptional regulator [Acetobacterium sp.]